MQKFVTQTEFTASDVSLYQNIKYKSNKAADTVSILKIQTVSAGVNPDPSAFSGIFWLPSIKLLNTSHLYPTNGLINKFMASASGRVRGEL